MPARTFIYRAGVRVVGTVLACDATAGGDLIFVSRAPGLDGRDDGALPRPRGRGQILTTELTLALAGAAGERLRRHALVAAVGRPFALGPLRLELYPSGSLPGAASLLCEAAGRRVVYAGRVGHGAAPHTRPAHALCLDATFAASRFSFPDTAEALADVGRFVAGALGARRPPVVLVDGPAAAIEVGNALAADGVKLRAHRTAVAAGVVFRGAGLGAPAFQRFEGRLGAGEALVWPLHARGAARLGALASPAVVLASPWAADPEALAEARADRGIALGSWADLEGLIRYVEATGAREVALLRLPGDELPARLRAQGIDAYPLGPPRQIALFSAA
jgi:hypothetical protein